ncbi:hypothetical protein GALMADRAFT_143482 [Galerina marginata CBS 339.88]|uniref:Uncharacterized protein n=1 Tax=Galerina marginata (strain CBS 339.88) TaxID=685588 RepID=A0A067SY33_GALM3|nr:hypothetical protein GALMADRAFT_143482 [Galerina marginata CBS 339.88]
MTWVEFKAQRDRINAQRELVETRQQRNERQARARNEPTTTAAVFEWLEDGHGNLVRTKVPKTDNQDTLERYEKGHTQYDAFWHEWDCCEDMGVGRGYDDEDDYNDDAGDSSDLNSASTFHDFNDDSNEIPMSTLPDNSWAHKAHSRSIRNSENDISSAQEGSDIEMATDDYPDYLAREIMEVLRLHFGYTGLLPLGPTCSVDNEKEQKKFMRVIGIRWVPRAALVFDRNEIQAAYNFIDRLQSNAKILSDEWDLSKGHRESVYLAKRMACIRLLEVKHCEHDPNRQRKLTWYMFDFGSGRTKKWMFTVTSAAVALTVCRLDNTYTDSDLAVYFLQCGMSFRTMQLSSSLSRAPYSAKSVAQQSSRGQGYTFLIDDYTTFENCAQTFLNTNWRARTACMMGGVTWRVACSVVDWNTVLSGPSGWSPTCCEYTIGIETGSFLEYADDALTKNEVTALSGMYYVLTGKGEQYENPSWYPTPDTFSGSGYDYGYWAESCEKEFEGWVRKGSKPGSTSLPDVPMRNPINKMRWAANLKGSAELRRARSKIEQLAKGLIEGR